MQQRHKATIKFAAFKSTSTPLVFEEVESLQDVKNKMDNYVKLIGGKIRYRVLLNSDFALVHNSTNVRGFLRDARQSEVDALFENDLTEVHPAIQYSLNVSTPLTVTRYVSQNTFTEIIRSIAEGKAFFPGHPEVLSTYVNGNDLELFSDAVVEISDILEDEKCYDGYLIDRIDRLKVDHVDAYNIHFTMLLHLSWKATRTQKFSQLLTLRVSKNYDDHEYKSTYVNVMNRHIEMMNERVLDGGWIDVDELAGLKKKLAELAETVTVDTTSPQFQRGANLRTNIKQMEDRLAAGEYVDLVKLAELNQMLKDHEAQ